MAISLNKHTIIGRVGSDPDSIPNSDGVRFSVATSESWKDDSGERKERTTWHKVVVWTKPTARFVKDYVKKGDLIYVEGQVETRSWDSEGKTVYITETVVRPFSGSIQLQSKDGGQRNQDGERSNRGGDSRSSSSRNDDYGYGNSSGGYGGGIDDDIPF